VHLLRRRPFALLFVGTAVNAIGSWTSLMALWGYAALHFHAGPGELAALILAWSVPAAIAGPFAGVPVDRFGARRVAMTSDVVGALAALSVLAVHSFHALAWSGILFGISKALGQPANAALPPLLVDDADLVAANAVLGAANDSSIVFGPTIAAVVIAAWGFHAAFLVDAVTYAIGFTCTAQLRVPPVARTTARRMRAELVDGLRITAHQPVLRRTMFLCTAAYIGWGAFSVIEPIYVFNVLHRSPTVLAAFQVCFGIGLVGAGLLVSRLGDRVATERSLAITVLASGAAAAMYVGTRSIVVAGIGVFLWGVDIAFFGAPARTLLQRNAPVEAHGRVLAFDATAESWAELAAIPVAGALAAWIGADHAGVAFATVAALAGGAALVSQSNRRRRALPPRNLGRTSSSSGTDGSSVKIRSSVRP